MIKLRDAGWLAAGKCCAWSVSTVERDAQQTPALQLVVFCSSRFQRLAKFSELADDEEDVVVEGRMANSTIPQCISRPNHSCKPRCVRLNFSIFKNYRRRNALRKLQHGLLGG